MFRKLTQQSILSFLALLTISLSGCATFQTHNDAKALRERALDYYTDQVMDNLIRGKNGLLMLHVDIANLNAQVTDTLQATVGGGQTLTNTSQSARSGIGLSALALTAINAAQRPFTFGFTPSRADLISYQTTPEVNDPIPYLACLQFLSLKDPKQPLSSVKYCSRCMSNSVDSVRERMPGQKLVEGQDYVTGTLTKWHGKQYYIPNEYKDNFFNLCLAITARIEIATDGTIASTTSKPAKPTKDGKAPGVKARGSGNVLFLQPKYNDSPENRLLEQLKSKVDSLQ